MAETIFITGGDLTEANRAEIAAAAPGAEIRYFPGRAALEAEIEAAEVVAGTVSPDGLARARRLRWVQSWAAGVDGLLFPELVESPVVVTSTSGNGAVPLAEHAMMLMLMLNRNARRWLRAQDERRWDKFAHGELDGLTCGIVGLGQAGQALARRAGAFGMRVIGLRRTPQPTPHVDELFPRERLHDLLAESDFVVVTAPRTPETVGMLGEAEFRAMKPTAHYVCVSRGGIADDAALLRALREGWIAGAGLDAHSEEPLPPDSPFWSAPNAIVTPHNGAANRQVRQRGVDVFVENLRRYRAGQPLINVVDKRRGY